MLDTYYKSVGANPNSVISQDFKKYTGVDSPFYVTPEFKDDAKDKLIDAVTKQALAEAKLKFAKIVESQMDLFLSAYSTQRDIDLKDINTKTIEQRKVNKDFDKKEFIKTYKFNKPMFSIEQAILDEQTIDDNSEAGRIDLVVIFSDGSASIYDHKFIEGKFKSNPKQKSYESYSGETVTSKFDKYDSLDHEAIMEKIIKSKMKS
jgi:hypothetical protein